MSNTKPPPPALPKPVLAALANARAWYLALPRAARVLLATTTTLIALCGGFVAIQRANESYTPLFTQLDQDDAAAIVAKLKEQKVPYRIGADGSTIEVPEGRSHELRLELASAGLPRGGGVGFESFDKMRLGATDFEQRVLYRRALEGELVRTIGTLGAVESARVHLVLPEKSVFVTRNEPASASIVLRLRPGRSLGPSEVVGIVHLVASAVPSLQPDHVAVVTTEGVTLHRPRTTAGEDDGFGNDEDSRAAARSYESSTEERVRAMLEKVVGAGHADVRVTADVDSSRVERLEEHFDPNRSSLRSEEATVERSNGGGGIDESVAGVPGAESNLPTGASVGASASAKPATSASAAPSASAASKAPASPSAVAAGGTVRESHTRNFEIDKVSEKRVSAGAALRRLAIAVVLDGARDPKGPARTQDDLDKIAALVKSAAGVNEARGDRVTVESMPFVEATDAIPEPVAATSAPFARVLGQSKRSIVAGAAVALIVVLGIGVVVGRRKRAAVPTALVPAGPAQAPSLEASLRPALDGADLRTRAHSRAAQDPATAALVLRFWLGTATPEPGDSIKS